MAYWFEIMLAIDVFLIEYLFFIRKDLFTTNSMIVGLLFLIMVILTIGLLSIGYINLKDERKKKKIREIKKQMWGWTIAMFLIFIIVQLSFFIANPLLKLISNLTGGRYEAPIGFFLIIVIMFILIWIFDKIKTLITRRSNSHNWLLITFF